MSTEFQSVDDFLKYRPSESTGTKRLKSWAKEKGFLNFWLHTKQFPCAVWYHRFPELVVRDKKDEPGTKLKNVWGRQHACWEDESILKKQRFRTPGGDREHPPKKCGACRLAEAIRSLIRSGAIKDTDVLFEFTGSDKPEENKLLHAGGMCSIWKRDDLDEPTKKRLAEHGVYMSKVWDENVVAKLSYVFVGVDNDDVGAGLQTAVQTQLVGDKVKKLINNEIASNAGDLGNPFVNPYCIQLVYNASEKKFDDKYDARRINRFTLTPEIERLIRGDKPDISKFVKKFDQDALRASLEAHATPIAKKHLPWDEIFVKVAEVEERPVEAPRAVQVPATVAPSPAPAATAPAAPVDPGPALIPCDDCHFMMKETDTKCARCGAVYEVDPAPAAAAPTAAAPAQAPAAAPSAEDLDGVYETDDVPF